MSGLRAGSDGDFGQLGLGRTRDEVVRTVDQYSRPAVTKILTQTREFGLAGIWNLWSILASDSAVVEIGIRPTDRVRDKFPGSSYLLDVNEIPCLSRR